ncbi:MAG TPA: D-alanine--D-alanine ligase [Anaerolineae bacterium]
MNHPPVLLLGNIDSAWTPELAAECQKEVDLMIEALRGAGHAVELIEVRRDVRGPLRGHDPRRELVFNWCEGLDGQPNAYDVVAETLEGLGFAFTGSDAWTLARTQNKADFKVILDREGIPTPRWRVFTSAHDAGEWTVYPAIVKPVAEHASHGLSVNSVVDDVTGLRRQIDAVMDTFGVGALAEEFIAGREIYTSIWGNGTPQALPLHEVDFGDIDDPRRRFVDYEAKWNSESFRYQHMPERCPADIDETLAGRVRSTALAAYRALRCRDYGRIDLRVRDGLPYAVDVNPNCDLSPDSGFVIAANIAGYDYGAMASRIVRWAAARMPV